MIITNVKIQVSDWMVIRAGLTKGDKLGVPIDPKDISLGVQWKTINDLQEEDFDKIEEYFINKKEKP